ARERRETRRVVRPISPVRSEIGISRTREKMRRIEHEQVELAAASAQKPRLSAEELRPAENLLRPCKCRDDGGISRHQGARSYPFRFQRDRKRADDIGEAAGLDDRIDLRGDRQDANGYHAFNPSIIGCVMRQMPCGVVRNLFASSSGSSPITSP